MKKAIIWGAAGLAKVTRPIIENMGYRLVAMIDRDPDIAPIVPGCPIFASLEELLRQLQTGTGDGVSFVVAIGGERGRDRIDIHQKLLAQGFSPLTVVHPRAWVAGGASLGEGAMVLGMAGVSEEVTIGRQTIVNVSACIDHEGTIGEGCHIMPGATLAGCVTVGDFCAIGSNATILPRIRIGAGAVVGAGSVVTKDVPENAVVVGAPARVVKLRQ